MDRRNTTIPSQMIKITKFRKKNLKPQVKGSKSDYKSGQLSNINQARSKSHRPINSRAAMKLKLHKINKSNHKFYELFASLNYRKCIIWIVMSLINSTAENQNIKGEKNTVFGSTKTRYGIKWKVTQTES